MLDENLPTYQLKPSSDSPHTVLYFTHNGSDPSPAYLLLRADPSLPAAKNKYAVALTDPSSTSIIYAETLVEPSWSQPTLSTAEIRAQQQSSGSTSTPPPAPTPITPDSVTLNLYNPDSQVTVRVQRGSWGKSDTYEFELPQQSFHNPSGSRLDRDEGSGTGPSAGIDFKPKVVFRWKKESRLGKEMTCYMTGKSVGGKKSKEPDITVAMFKEGRHGAGTVAIYEPNLRRVDVQDQKGLEVVLLLGAEVIRDLFLNPNKGDPFNVSGAPLPPSLNAAGPGQRRDSPAPPLGNAAAVATSGAMASAHRPPQPQAHGAIPPGQPGQNSGVDAETERLQAMVAEEERQARERERRDAAEAQRIQAMLEQEEAERQRKAAEVDRETERLRKEFGVQGQSFAGGAGGVASPDGPTPHLPPRPGPSAGHSQSHAPGVGGSWYAPTPQAQGHGHPPPPPRPVSAGPQTQHMQGAQMSGGSSGWSRPAFAPVDGNSAAAAGNQNQTNGTGGAGRPGKKPGSSNPLSGLFGKDGVYGNPAASVSNFFNRHRDGYGEGGGTRGVDSPLPEEGEEERRRLSKKRSVHF